MTAPGAAALDPRALRDAFGAFPTGVTVVTTRAPDGALFGFTANSFTSVSLEPPLLLVCPARRLSSFAAFERCRRFAVSVLAEGQEDVSNVFAGFKGDRFAQVAWRPDAFGAPLIEGAAAAFSCETAQVVPAGDHVILLGAVRAVERSDARGLGYAAGRYFSLGLERAAASATGAARPTFVGAVIEREGRVLLAQTADGAAPPVFRLEGAARARESLSAHLARAGLKATLGKAYSIFDDRRSGARHVYFLAAAADDAAGGLGQWRDVDALPRLTIASEALRVMLARYALERETSAFSLYVGDEVDGDTHAIS